MSITPARTRRIAGCPAAEWSWPQASVASGSYSATAASRSPSVRAAQASSKTSAGPRATGGSIRSSASVNRPPITPAVPANPGGRPPGPRWPAAPATSSRGLGRCPAGRTPAGLGRGTATVPRWLVRSTAAGLLTRSGHSDMWQRHVLSAQPAGHPGTLRPVWVGIAGALWETRGDRGAGAGLSPVSGRREGARRARPSAPPGRRRAPCGAVRADPRSAAGHGRAAPPQPSTPSAPGAPPRRAARA